MGNSWFSSNLRKLNFGPVGTKMASIATVDGDEAFSDENGQAFEREVQSLPNFSPINVAKFKRPVEARPRRRRKEDL